MNRALCSILTFFLFLPLATAQRVNSSTSRDSNALAPAATCSPVPCVIPEKSIVPQSSANTGNFLVNPLNSQQWLTGGGGGLALCGDPGLEFASYESTNTGDSWSVACLPPIDTTLNQNPWPPSFAYDRNGTAYVAYNSYGMTAYPYPLVLSVSNNNGVSWGTPVEVESNNDGTARLAVQAAVDVSPTSPFSNSLYILENVGSVHDSLVGASVLVSRDGGATFHAKQVIAPIVATTPTVPQLAIGSNGTLYLTATYCPNTSGRCHIMFSRSANGGVTWSKPKIIANITLSAVVFGFQQPGVITVDNSSGAFAGRLYVVTTSYTGSFLQVVYTSSADGGKTWGPLVPLAPGFTHDQANPWISVSSTGTVGVTWMDRRDDPNNVDFRVYLATSADGGQSFGTNFAIDDGLETATATNLPTYSPQNLWQGTALWTIWSSSGTPAGVVLGGVQF